MADERLEIDLTIKEGNFTSTVRQANRDMQQAEDSANSFTGAINSLGSSSKFGAVALAGFATAGITGMINLAKEGPQTSLAFEKMGLAATLAGLQIDSEFGGALNRVADSMLEFVQSDAFDKFLEKLDTGFGGLGASEERDPEKVSIATFIEDLPENIVETAENIGVSVSEFFENLKDGFDEFLSNIGDGEK